MQSAFRWLPLAYLCCVGLIFLPSRTSTAEPYTFSAEHDPDGIGKFYLGREIAHVMGHQGSDWLERPEREKEENTSAIIKALKLKPGETVADIGAGTGYYTRRMAVEVGPKGKVLAVDIQPEMLRALTNRLAGTGITNIVPVLGTEKDPGLAAGTLDLALLVDVYHELEYPLDMMRAIRRALKPHGRVVLVEYRGEDPNVPIKPLHKMTEAQIRRELQAHGFDRITTHSGLPWQHLVIGYPARTSPANEPPKLPVRK